MNERFIHIQTAVNRLAQMSRELRIDELNDLLRGDTDDPKLLANRALFCTAAGKAGVWPR